MSVNKKYISTLFTMLMFVQIFWVTPTPSYAQSLEKISVQLHWLNQFEFAGFYIAKEKGFYADAGLDVTILPFLIGKTNVVNTVVSNRAQYGVNYSSLIIDYHKGMPVTSLAAIFQESPLVLMTRDDGNIKTVKDLENRKVMMGGDALNAAPIMALLNSHGLFRSDIQQIPHTHNIDDLILGHADAMTAYISNEPFDMAARQQAYRIFHPKNVGLSFYGDLLFSSEAEIRDHPDRADAFTKATLKGWKYAFSNIEETIQLIQSKYNDQHKSYESLLFEADELKKLAYKGRQPFGNIDIVKLQNIENAYRLMGVELSKKSIRNFVWTGAKHTNNTSIVFTPKEEKFIKEKSVMAATTTNWPPFAFVDKNTGRASGIGFDYWEEISKTANLKAEIMKFDDFSKQLQSLKDKKVDLMYSSGVTEERKKFAKFSQPYASFPISIATSKDEHFIQDASLLKGKKIAVGKNFTSHKMMLKAYPDFDYIPVKNAKEGLQLLSQGDAYAYVDIMPTLAYEINRFGFTNLKISGNTGLMFELRLMIRDDYPELLSITNKVIAHFSPEKKQEIIKKWINVKYQQEFNYMRYWPYAVFTVIALGTVFLWLLLSRLNAIQASRAKSEFLSSMSHELRTPLNAILGFAQVLELNKKFPLQPSQKNAVDQIIKGGNHLLALINDVLDLSKIESGNLDLQFEPVNTQILLGECVSTVTPLLKDQNLTIDTKSFSGSVIQADYVRFKQSLLNILSNAIKYNKEGGEITISSSLLKNEMQRISVSDTGYGIHADKLALLFEPFSRLGREASQIEGTGIGLSITQKLITSMNGVIGFESIEGVGSNFWIDIPLAAAHFQEHSIALGHKNEAFDNNVEKKIALEDGKKLVIYIEDNPDNIRLIETILAPFSNIVLKTFHTAELGLSAAQEQHTDLVLMDINLPGMNGLEALSALKAQERTYDIPVIAISASAMPHQIKEGLETGFLAYLTKPLYIPEFLEKVTKTLNIDQDNLNGI